MPETALWLAFCISVLVPSKHSTYLLMVSRRKVTCISSAVFVSIWLLCCIQECPTQLSFAAAMSLAAEDDGTAWPTNPRCSLQALRGRGLRQSTLRMGPRFRSYAGPSMIDPFSVLHPTMLLGHQAGQNSPDLDAAYAMMASLVSDLDGPNSMSHPGAYSGSQSCHAEQLNVPPALHGQLILASLFRFDIQCALTRNESVVLQMASTL